MYKGEGAGILLSPYRPLQTNNVLSKQRHAPSGISRHRSKKRTATANKTRIHIDLWVTEYILTYDGRPSYAVSIMPATAAVHEHRA